MTRLHINGKKHSVEVDSEILKINIEIVDYYELLTVVEGPRVPVIISAIVNAIFKAMGKRYNSMPLSDFNLVKNLI